MSAPAAAECRGEPGRVMPEVDRDACEGKAECARVCPYGVFEVGVLPPAQRAALSWFGSLKSWAHGYRQALVAKPNDCHACGLCVDVCPEEAIRLVSSRS